jgi:hypothetical protein
LALVLIFGGFTVYKVVGFLARDHEEGEECVNCLMHITKFMFTALIDAILRPLKPVGCLFYQLLMENHHD